MTLATIVLDIPLIIFVSVCILGYAADYTRGTNPINMITIDWMEGYPSYTAIRAMEE